MTPIVAIGASAGGLEQISALLRDLPDDTGAAFVVLQHLDPRRDSQLPDLLGRVTSMPVVPVEDGMPIAPDRVHVMPSARSLEIRADHFHLSRVLEHESVPTLIDRFFQSLATERSGSAVGIILSGTGSDGALGLKQIKAEGGLTMAQDPESAAHDGMPRATIRSSVVDYIADTPALAQALINHLRLNHPYTGHDQRDCAAADATDRSETISDEQLDAVLELLRDHDDRRNFATYKPNMLKRRIQRRMGLNGMKQAAGYQKLLAEHKRERDSLGQDFLISVTDFFRESRTYEALRESAIRNLLKGRDVTEPIRVWVPGCATGEEAYSLAILLAEEIEASGRNHQFILFATDVDQRALDTARAGLYAETIAEGVSAPRLRRFFDRIDSQYQVKRFLRERVVFASQNMIEDPPYSRLDLISCRHVLMYLKPATQRRVLAMFHFALKSQGYLFLGNSETMVEQVDLFESLVKEARIFRRIGPDKRNHAQVPFAYRVGAGLATAAGREGDQSEPRDNAERIARDLLLKDHVPAAVLINRKYEILCGYGPTHDVLALPFGGASLGLMEMVHDELRSHVRVVAHRAFRDGSRHEVSTRPQAASPQHMLRIAAQPVPDREAARGLLLITFERMQPAARAERPEPGDNELNRQLADELESTRDGLQSTIQALEATNEDLEGSNEEILSMNEALQSTNEELETSREELQSLNEELTTVNGELEDKVAELDTANNDLNNLFLGTQVATLFLDRGMCIKRFTPTIKELLSLIASDIGRPLGDITRKFADPELMADAETAVEQLGVREKEVQAHNGHWYLRRVLPYRTRDNAIDGAVVTFADITDLKRAWLATSESEQRLDMAMSAINGGMWEMQIDPRYPDQLPDAIYLSARLKRLLGFEDDQLANCLSAWQERVLPDDRSVFTNVVQRQSEARAQGLHYRIRHRNGELRWFASFGTLIRNENNANARWIGIDCDITDIKQNVIQTQQVQVQLRLLADALPALVVFVDRQRIVQLTNTAYNEWFGTTSEQVIGQSVDQALETDAYNTIEPCIETALEGKAVTCDLEVEHPQHGRRTLQVEHMPHIVDGQVLGFFALMTNTSNHKRRKVDQLAQQSNLAYVHRLATVGEMASTLAHDLNQPLSAINAYAGALTRMLHNGKPADDTTPLLGKIADQVNRAGHIIRQTRDFVGHRDHGRDTIDINELVNAAIALLAGRATKLNVDIRLDMHAALPAVNGFRVQIEQVLINLINNAFDTMEDIDNDKRALCVTTAAVDARYIQVVITDSGAGIAPDKITAIFDAFHTTKLEGMGMGLAISRSIAQWHGGQLWVESRAGYGASFYLKLPIASEHPDAD